RTKLAYDALVNGIGQYTENPISTAKENYHNNCTDEFIKPIVVVDKKNQPVVTIKSDDAVLFFNFRTDRGRQLTQVLTQQDFHEWNMHKLRLHFSTMTNYDDTFKGIHVLFEKDNLSQTLGEEHTSELQSRE